MKKMGTVVRFPRHERVSATSRAARVVKISAVTPPMAARYVPSTADHHSAGMLSLCHHFETADARAPISSAMASLEGQSSMIPRNELICDMSELIGHSVLKRKANLSLDGEMSLGHNVPMTETETETEYKQAFMKRVAAARIARGLKQWQLAEALGMPQDRYKQYESRSLLPHHLIGRFCIVTRVDPEWLLTGHGQKPLKQLRLADAEPEPATKPKRSRSRRAA